MVDANRVAKRINKKIRRMKKQTKKRKSSSTIMMKKRVNRFEHQSYSKKKVNTLLRMVQYTVVNGLVALGTAMESRRGLTGPSTKGCGSITKPSAKEHSTTQTTIPMKATGSTTRRMALESTRT